jgi:hypothetical protein
MNVLVSNYNIAFAFDYNGKSGPLIEGVEMLNCQAYNRNVFVHALNVLPGYLAPQFSFITTGTEISGTVFNLRGLQDVVIENTLIECDGSLRSDLVRSMIEKRIRLAPSLQKIAREREQRQRGERPL